MTYQSQLDKLMQMATIEQLKDLMRQFNNNVSVSDSEKAKEKEKSFSNQEILSLPIVQKVVFAYEEELKAAKNHLNQGHQQCTCHDNNKIFNRLDEQHKLFTDMFFKMEDKMNELSNDIHKLNIILNVSNKSSHFVAAVEHPVSEDDFIEHVDVASEPILAHDIVAADSDEHVVDEHVVDEHVNIKLEIQEIVDNNLNQHIDDSEYIIVENNFNISEDDESVISEEAEETDEAVEEAVEETDEADEEAVEEAVEETDEAVDEEADEEVEEVDEEVEGTDEEVEGTDEEAVEETDEEVVTDDADAEDEEVFEIEIDDITYFATDEENGILYEVTKTGEVGKKVGIIKDGEPIFS